MVHAIGHAIEAFEVFRFAVTPIFGSVFEHITRLPRLQPEVYQRAAICCIGVKRLHVYGNRVARILLFVLCFSDTILLCLIDRKTRACGVADLYAALLRRLKTVQTKQGHTCQYDQYRHAQPLLTRQ